MKVGCFKGLSSVPYNVLFLLRKYDYEKSISYEDYFIKNNYDVNLLYEQIVYTLRDFIFKDLLKYDVFYDGKLYEKVLNLPLKRKITDNDKREIISYFTERFNFYTGLDIYFDDYVKFWDKALVYNNLKEFDVSNFFEKVYPDKKEFYAYNVIGNDKFNFVYKVIAYNRDKLLSIDVIPNKDDLVISKGLIFCNHISQYHRWTDLHLIIHSALVNHNVSDLETLILLALYVWEVNNLRYLKNPYYKRMYSIGLKKDDILNIIKYHTNTDEIVKYYEVIKYFDKNVNSGLVVYYDIKNPVIPVIAKFNDVPVYILKKVIKLLGDFAKILG